MLRTVPSGGPAVNARRRLGLLGQVPAAGDDLLDDGRLRVGVVLDVLPLAAPPARASSARTARGRRRGSAASRGSRPSARAPTLPGEKTWRLTFVSGPLKTRCSCQSGSRGSGGRSRRPRGRGRRSASSAEFGDDHRHVDARLRREAGHRRRARVLEPQDLVARGPPGSGGPRARTARATRGRSRRG